MIPNPSVSIIIPCFNSGNFLLEALDSCSNSKFKDFEIVIIDDGSTDSLTLDVFDKIDLSGSVTLIRKHNGGASSARNLGVESAKGEYLLFLDSDNRIRPDYLERACKVLKEESEIAVVYAKAFFFGKECIETPDRFEVKDFSPDSLLVGNYVDMCSLVRRSVFLEVGGFDESSELCFGEDWDLWIRISQLGWKFQLLNDILFEYRIRSGSLMDKVDFDKRRRTLEYLGSKHGYLIHQRYRQYFRVMHQIKERPFSYFFRILYYKYILRKSLIDV